MAIFWRADYLQLRELEFFRDGSSGTLLRCRFQRRSDDKRLSVICCHLGSGDTAEKEQERLLQIHRLRKLGPGLGPSGGLPELLERSAADGAVLLCMDANSQPNRDESENDTVWRTLRGVPLVQSVWDADFDAEGRPRPEAATTGGGCRGGGSVVTTNKMRGPLSKQAAKIGEHMLHVIDHVYFLNGLEFVGHGWGPLRFSSPQAAVAQLLPTLDIPSDHAPVCADFEWA